MIKRSDEHRIDVHTDFLGGIGQAVFKRIIEKPEDLYGKGRVFSIVTLEKDCSIGFHIHKGDGEYYYIISGEAEYDDNGTVKTLYAGDTSFTPDGKGHAITNRKEETCTIVALVIYN